MDDDPEVILTPGDAAKKLGVSPSGLRRLAVIYGEVFGELPKDPQGTSRIWPGRAVARLEAARALLASGQARTIKDALQVAESGAAPPVVVAPADARTAEALQLLAAEVRALRDELRELREEGQRKADQLPKDTGAAASGGGDDTLLGKVLERLRRFLRP